MSVMTNLSGTTHHLKKTLGNLYGLRTWVEYGFRQCKQELGWTNYRLTKWAEIEKWWELIMSAYVMISLNSKVFCSPPQSQNSDHEQPSNHEIVTNFSSHQQWNNQGGWKHTLNNLRLIIQPLILLWLIVPWLEIFPNRHICLGLHQLIAVMNQFHPYFPDG